MNVTSLNFFSILFFVCLYFPTTKAFVITQDMVQDGLSITESGEWTLSESITVSQGNGITVVAHGVVLDLNGYRIRAVQEATIGISLQTNDCLIKNGTIEGFSGSGISIDMSDGIVLSHISLISNQVGVRVMNSSSVELKHIVVQEIGYRGIEIKNSEYVHLIACNVKNSQYQGIVVHENCSGVMIDASHIHSCQDVGLVLESDGVQCTYLSVQHCNNDGVVIKGKNCECNTVLSLHNEGSGFLIEGTSPIMRNCKAGYNDCDGIRLEENAVEATILGGAYALNKMIGINNNGNLTHTVSSAQVYENKKRNIYRITNMH